MDEVTQEPSFSSYNRDITEKKMMEITKARDKYFEVCGDKYAYQHFLNFRGNQLGARVVAEWLVDRMGQDTKPLVNLDGSINSGVNQASDTEDFINSWCQSTN